MILELQAAKRSLKVHCSEKCNYRLKTSCFGAVYTPLVNRTSLYSRGYLGGRVLAGFFAAGFLAVFLAGFKPRVSFLLVI